MLEREKVFWETVKDLLKKRWSCQRHEDKYVAGIPDVSYAVDGESGWIEFKVITFWPKNDAATVKVSHFTAKQKVWLFSRSFHGHSWLFLLVLQGKKKEYLLFNGKDVLKIGKLTKQEMFELSAKTWESRIDADELIRILSRPHSRRSSKVIQAQE